MLNFKINKKYTYSVCFSLGSEVTLGSNLHVTDLDLNDTVQLKVNNFKAPQNMIIINIAVFKTVGLRH